MRSRTFFEFGLVFLGNRGVINATCIVWVPKCPCHYVAHALGPVFSVPNASVTSVYESRVLRAAASTFEG